MENCSLENGRCKSRLLGLIGFSGTLIVFVGTILSLCFYPNYNIFGQFVSDLGNVTKYPQAVIFNGAMVFGNAILILFNISVYGLIGERKYGIGAVITGCISSYGGILVGCAPSDIDQYGHSFAVMLIFFSVNPCMIFYTLGIMNSKRGYTPKYFAVGTFAAFCFNIFYLGVVLDLGLFDPANLLAELPPVYIPTILEWISIYLPYGIIMLLSIYHLS